MTIEEALGNMNKEEYQILKELIVGRKDQLKGLNDKQKEVIIGKWIREAEKKWLGGSTESSKKKKPRVHIPPKKYRAILRAYGSRCAMCGQLEAVDVHHIDHDRSNNKESNLIAVCKRCHYKNLTKEQYRARWKKPKYTSK